MVFDAIGASVLPVMLIRRRAYFVLGRQARSGQWSDFGGACIPDESAEQCAAREFVEESWCAGGYSILPWTGEPSAAASAEPSASAAEPSREFLQSTLQRRLERRQYLLRADLSRHPRCDRGFSCFVVAMPFDPACVERFRERRPLPDAEVDRIALVSVDRLAQAVLLQPEAQLPLRRSFLEAAEQILRELADRVDRSAFAPRSLLAAGAWGSAEAEAEAEEPRSNELQRRRRGLAGPDRGRGGARRRAR